MVEHAKFKIARPTTNIILNYCQQFWNFVIVSTGDLCAKLKTIFNEPIRAIQLVFNIEI